MIDSTFKKTLNKVGIGRAIACAGIFALLSACAPASTGLTPSVALQEQLDTIRQQQQQQAQILQQLQQRLEQLQQGDVTGTPGLTVPAETAAIETAPAEETIPVYEPPPAEEIVVPVTAAQEVRTVAASASSYLAAFSDLASGRWAAAEAGFQRFIADFGDHQYAPNARYWLANAQLSQGKTEPAMSNLRQIIVDPKGQAKAPSALLQLEQLYRRQGMNREADDIAEQIRSRFPESPEAQQIYRSSEQKD